MSEQKTEEQHESLSPSYEAIRDSAPTKARDAWGLAAGRCVTETLEKEEYYKLMRSEDVMRAITKGAAGMSWSLLYETEHNVRWDRRREAWVTEDGAGITYTGGRG